MPDLRILGEHDAATIEQMERCLLDEGSIGVLCADGHKGYSQPVGGVVALRDRISISGVGFDIGCGNLACRTDAVASDVRRKIERIMDRVQAEVAFGVGRANADRVDHELFDDDAWKIPTIAGLKQLARDQLGTVGGGNHYVDIFIDETEAVWVGVHFGSRGFGHKTATAFLKAAGGADGMDVPPTEVDADSSLGGDYLASMELAGRYAYAGREYAARHVATRILGARVEEEVHNHHNFAWREEHFGAQYWVIRKGATPAFPGERGFVGGSMGDDAVIVEGVDTPEAARVLHSTIHGAGRVMSRTAAKGKSFKGVDGKPRRTEGLISRVEMDRWLRRKGVCLRGGDVDEAPQAYRRLDEVLRRHAGSIRVLHTLKPIGVAMAGAGVVDPYRD